MLKTKIELLINNKCAYVGGYGGKNISNRGGWLFGLAYGQVPKKEKTLG